MVALAGGIAGLSIAKTAELGGLLGRIQLFPERSESGSWFAVLVVATYAIFGFYVMYFVRKLALNPALAEARDRLERKNELISRASQVAAEMAKKVSMRVLSGKEFSVEPTDEGEESTERMKAALFSKEVDEFLQICEDEVSKGSLPVDFVNKASALHFYRIRFKKKDSPERLEQEEKAVAWITRAVMIDPLDPLPQIKLAEVYGLMGQDDECVSILERLERNDESPQYLPQWLGFYLLFVDGGEQKAIRHSLAFLEKFPNEPVSMLNISRAYSQLYEEELRISGKEEIPESPNRQKALEFLSKSIRLDADLAPLAKLYSEPGDSFEVIAKSPEFLRLIATQDAEEGQKDQKREPVGT